MNGVTITLICSDVSYDDCDSAGTVHAVYSVSVGGKQGEICRFYKWRKRDILRDEMWATAEIAEDMRAFFSDCSPDYYPVFETPKFSQNTELLAFHAANTTSYGVLVYACA